MLLTQKSEDDKKFYTSKDIQSIMGCGRTKLYELLTNETFPTIKIGRQFYVPKAQFDKWVERNLYGSVILN
ncbi:helix-turn-helix domain-containing protein [Pygmaiobacter massiliensis]|uniref:helix-turn-helix domain-containing protein n=1 Tax=Pygmaiobacter massiliensis TaxID=1917873 RepID=UPI000C7E7E65